MGDFPTKILLAIGGPDEAVGAAEAACSSSKDTGEERAYRTFALA